MTTGLYLLRAAQLGIPLGDLELISIGMLYDMFTESDNDTVQHAELATQEDVDRL